jgi:single-strand selective monofunctional uracil DNA glycosylase
VDPVNIQRALTKAIAPLRFAPPVTHVYDPLVYARATAEDYLERFARRGVGTLLLGMNPGPWGMAQTGVPFGEVAAVRDWIGVRGKVDKPEHEHPKRPVTGLDCPRSEVSGRRLWGWARDRFGTPDAFFERFFVWNYCPLAFLEESGRNRTPDKLPASESAPLFAACDEALRRLVAHLEPQRVLGIGKFAEARARAALGRVDGFILHPSPASPAANRGWAEQAERQLAALGVDL